MNLLRKMQKDVFEKMLLDQGVNSEEFRIKIVFPASGMNFLSGLFNKENRKLRKIYEEIEERVRERADSFYENIKKFREVGGYLIIKENQNKYYLQTIFETIGEEGRQVVLLGRGVDIRWECFFPKIGELKIDWDNAVFFIKYHSHPFVNNPHPQDIAIGTEEVKTLPLDVRYLQTIYAKNWHTKFFWLEHYRE